MPLTADHLKKSSAAETLALSLDVTKPGAIDWAITMLFYSALHQVEAYFAKQGIHHGGHGGMAGRDSRVENDPYTNGISQTYQRMKTASVNARYNSMTYAAGKITAMKTDLDTIKAHIAPLL